MDEKSSLVPFFFVFVFTYSPTEGTAKDIPWYFCCDEGLRPTLSAVCAIVAGLRLMNHSYTFEHIRSPKKKKSLGDVKGLMAIKCKGK